MQFELGEKPMKPQTVTGTWTGRGLSITAGNAGKTIHFTVPVQLPAEGTGLYPAVILTQNSSTIPLPANVATIQLPVDAIASQAMPGTGIFYDLYGKSASAGTMMAWAWAVSRVVDVLEQTPQAQINVSRLGVTGCSRYGKGALVSGAFDDRIALVIPQESGAGGDSCWRTAQALRNAGSNVETAQDQATTGWMGKAFNAYASPSAIGRLPVDHHELAALVAPRGLYSTGNGQYEWLGKTSALDCMSAANKVFTALGVPDNQGFNQDAGHTHCYAFPASQKAQLDSFIQKFLFNSLGVTAGAGITSVSGRPDPKWAPWAAPTLA
ncbi:hypothetical protein LTS18_005433 [Coniosporium uncinatum]|uniref:Uncharacterized protein n=1 Tax=Coniosporium uncinatum TaxID=93489 RepID=A0ACC3D505_9PEZI|nr:hypothetical protein LTS18_005433 [Coniosporium uncinatum]